MDGALGEFGNCPDTGGDSDKETLNGPVNGVAEEFLHGRQRPFV